jgi:hypothetical protein
MPALVAVASSKHPKDTVLFWFAFLLVVFASFYYQSRIAWLAILALVVLGCHVLGKRQVLICLTITLLFIAFSPWASSKTLSPFNIAQTYSLEDEPGRTIVRFGVSLFGWRIPYEVGASL